MTRETWTVLPLPGLTIDCLGNYLAALGLLRLAAREWLTVRGCWRGDQFALVNGPLDTQALCGLLLEVAAAGSWTGYENAWDKAQKADTKAKSATNVARWQAREAMEELLPMFQAHLVAGQRLGFNPLLGTGGNAGKRNFSKGRSAAADALRGTRTRWGPALIASDAIAYLAGSPCRCLGDFGAGSWFCAANKAFNSGAKRPFRDGQVTPWAMVLACEGLPFFGGAASRRLGSARKAQAAFPFSVAAAAPGSANETGRVVAEVWLPVWDRPMTPSELLSLFRRGRAELHGRAATTAPAFSVSVVHRGVDAGIVGFGRFQLLRTTSEQTFESRLASVVHTRGAVEPTGARVTGAVLGLRDSLPSDSRVFAGLRGPLDRALIEFAAEPDVANARTLTDTVISVLRKVDLNRGHRKKEVRFSLLPPEWALHLVGAGSSTEVRLALALASLRPTWKSPASPPTMVTAPFLAYWLGAQPYGNSGRWVIPEPVPFRRVWSGTDLTGGLAATLRRRLVEEAPEAEAPFSGSAPVTLADVQDWLDDRVDEDLLAQWLFRFSLVDWTNGRRAIDAMLQGRAGKPALQAVSGELALFALLKPLFCPATGHAIGATRSVRVGALSRVAALLDGGQTEQAVLAARSVYRAAGVELADVCVSPGAARPRRLLAGLMVPVVTGEVASAFARWRSPQCNPSHR